MQRKTPIKLKVCTSCGKSFSSLWKTRMKDGKKESFCQSCWQKQEKKDIKQKKEVQKLKRKIKRERITESKLDQVTSRTVRSVYPLFCHGCNTPLEFNTAQSGHFVSRRARSVRFSIMNQLPVCKYCNFYDQSHVYSLGKWLNIYWGEGTADKIRDLGRTTFKPSQPFKDALYELYSSPPKGVDLEDTRRLIMLEYENLVKLN